MADLTDSQTAQTVKVIGSDSSGVETGFIKSSATNELATYNPGFVSTLNATTTPLTANSIFTGTFEEVSNFAFLTVTLNTDQASAIDGVQYQWSSDGINVDRTESTDQTANAGRAGAITIRSRYFRIRYVNGTVNQTFFRLAVVYHQNGTGIITKPLDGAVTTESFGSLVQAPVMVRLPDNTFDNVAGLKLNITSLLGTVDHDAMFGHLGHTFSVVADNIGISGAGEEPLVHMDNPSGSGKAIRFDKFIFGIPNTGSAIFRIYVSPTITANGTPLSAVGHRQIGQSSSIGLFYTNPTVSANGTKFFSVRTADTGVPYTWETDFSLILDPGFKMLVTIQKTAGGTVFNTLYIEYSEL